MEICRRSLARDHREDAPGRRRALPHLSVVIDLAALEEACPELIADVRAEAEHVGALSRATLEAHHIHYWSRGGPADLANLRLFCWQHHRAIHAHDPPRRA